MQGLPHVLFPRILARKDYAHEAQTFGQCLATDLFFPDFFYVVQGALGEFDGAF